MHVHCYPDTMTRKQVARRLGKSVATVRRLEGHLLHPSRDSRGIHRFDPNEVESLVQDVERGRVVLVAELARTQADPTNTDHAGTATCARCQQLQEEVVSLERRLSRERASHDDEVARLRRKAEQEAADVQSGAVELVALMQDLMDEMA